MAFIIIEALSENYPSLLKEISDPPDQLFIRGNASLLSEKNLIAVVGTRKISLYGKQVLQEIIPPLVRAGAVIVSGLAYGVDALAHQIALQHGGKCIAVFGCGVDIIYPEEHRELAKKILEMGGTLVSEFESGTLPLKHHFPARNRIISGLSRATIIIEAQEGSGSLITAKLALDQNREVYAVPGNIFQANQQGTNRLIEEGAYPITSSKNLLLQLGFSEENQEQHILFESEAERLLYSHFNEPRTLDEMSGISKLSISELSSIISHMELKGLIKNLGGMRYCKT